MRPTLIGAARAIHRRGVVPLIRFERDERRTPFLQAQVEAGRDEPEVERQFFENARPTSLIKRFADPAEVAAMIAYVASARASATTGAALRVDGGTVKSAF